MQKLRTDFAKLERALREAEAHCANLDEDAEDYVIYERQFEKIARSRDAVAALLAESGDESAAQAELKIRLDLAWRELLDEATPIVERRTRVGD